MRRGSRNVQPETLRELLENYTVPNLKKLAGLLESGLPTRKAEIVALMVRHLEDAERLRELWRSLDTLQQAAVSEALASPEGRFDPERFHAKYGGDPDWGESRYSDFVRPSMLRLFIYQGIVPRDLRPVLAVFVPPARAAAVETHDAPPAAIAQEWYDYELQRRVTVDVPLTVRETERGAQHDLLAVLRLIDAGKVRASATTRRVTAAGAREVADVLQGGDFYSLEETLHGWDDETIGPIKAFAWPLIVQDAGLAELAGTRLQLTGMGKRALSSPPQEVIRRAWNRWQRTTLLDEFSRIETIKGQSRTGKRHMTAASGRRAAIVAALGECPAHAWIAVDEFSRYMRAAGHTFEVSRDLWSLYIGDVHYGSLGYSGFGEWHIIQVRYILTYLFEYAATLGLIDVAYIPPAGARSDYRELWGVDDLACLSRYDGLQFFRINALGAWCLGIAEASEPAPVEIQPALKVLPNMEIVATEVPSPADVLFLERIAVPRSDFVWQIERARVLEAAEQGYAVADIVDFLRAKSSNALPDNVATFFREAAERASSIVARGPALLIEARDAALAALIANDSRTRSLCLLAGERHLVVPAEVESAFRRALHDLGYGLAAFKG
jgi:hypothetical protein